MYRTTRFTPPAASVADNAVSTIFDSTYGLGPVPSTTVVGNFRGRYPRYRIVGWIRCATQDVTARLDYLSEAGAWVTAANSATVTAGTDKPISWLANSSDWRLVTLNGATGPSALTFHGFHVTDNPDSGT